MNYLCSWSSSFFLLSLQVLLSPDSKTPEVTRLIVHQSPAARTGCEIQMLCCFLTAQTQCRHPALGMGFWSSRGSLISPFSPAGKEPRLQVQNAAACRKPGVGCCWQAEEDSGKQGAPREQAMPFSCGCSGCQG